MCHVTVTNPQLALSMDIPYLYLHYMEHGSFSGEGSIHSGRVDIPQLLTVLERQWPCEPNDHQLPVDGNDSDTDLLADSEEATAGYDPNEADQDNDITPDGIELAKQCVAGIQRLPSALDPNEPNKPYKLLFASDGYETCEICGLTITMDHWDIINPRLGLTVNVPVMAAHYMDHGSFSYWATYHTGRIDVAALVQALEMPSRCGDLGTEFLAGDLNEDCQVSLADVDKLTERWLKDCGYFGTPYILGDLSEDCEIDLADFAKLADQWEECTDPNQGACD